MVYDHHTGHVYKQTPQVSQRLHAEKVEGGPLFPNGKPDSVESYSWNFYQAINERYGVLEGLTDACGDLDEDDRGPRWWDGTGLNVWYEEERRDLPVDTLDRFEVAWSAGKRFGDCSMELLTGKHRKLEGVFSGDGETFDDWDAYTAFKAAPGASKGVADLDYGTVYQCGAGDRTGTLVRILKGQKAAGKAGEAKRQSCFVALLADADD